MSQSFDIGVITAMEKVAISLTPEGHKFDEELAEMRERAGAEQIALSQRYGAVGHKGKKGKFLRALRGFTPADLIDPRHEAYVAKMHGEGRNAWNPWGGAKTPSKYEKGGDKKEYGKFEVSEHSKKKD